MKNDVRMQQRRSFSFIMQFSFILFATIVVTSSGLNLGRTTRPRNIQCTTAWSTDTVPSKRTYLDSRSRAALRAGTFGGDSSGRRKIPRKVTTSTARCLVPLSTALVIGGFSFFEITKGVSEATARRIGHAHGISVLAFIRVCNSLAILQTQTEELKEQIEKITDDGRRETRIAKLRRIVLSRLILSSVVTIVACVFASVACLVEIIEDLKPGAHHGALLLSLSELLYQVQRYCRHKQQLRRGGEKNFATDDVKPSLLRIPFRALIALAAAAYSGIELYEDFRPGAHHGVALLSLAELSENIHRSKVFR